MTGPYQFDEQTLKQRLEQLQSQAGGDLLAVMCQSTAKRVRARNLAYLEFGPWWWSVKKTLNDAGYSFGATTNEMMVNRFSASSPELVLIAGWECADEYRDSQFVGSRDFTLDEDGEEVMSLFDPDMEAAGLAGG